SRNPLMLSLSPMRALGALAIGACCASLVHAQTIHATLARTLNAYTMEGKEVAFSPDGRLLVTSSPDKFIKIWNVNDGRLVRTIPQPEGIASAEFSPDGQLIATGSYDHSVRLWRVSDGSLVREMKSGGTVWTVGFSA